MIIRRENERTIKVLVGHFFSRNRQRAVVKKRETNNENSQKYFTSFGPFFGSSIGPHRSKRAITFASFSFHGCYVLPEQLGKSLNHRQTRDFEMEKKRTEQHCFVCVSLSLPKTSGWPSLGTISRCCVCVCGSRLFLLLLLPSQQHPKSVPKNRKYVSRSFFFLLLLFLSLPKPEIRDQQNF